jgi:hypothetical protein
MTSDISKNKKGDMGNDAILKELAVSLSSLKYGEIVIKVHDSKIIQIEKTEKIRYDITRCIEQGGGI